MESNLYEKREDAVLDRAKGIDFCQKPSKHYLDVLEECGGDPRLTAAVWQKRYGNNPEDRTP